MNLGKKIFCRVFQKVMHLLIPLFPYREPKLLKDIEEIINILETKNIQNIMLVTGKRIRCSGLTESLEKLLIEHHILCTVYDGTLPNPTSMNIEEAYSLYVSNNCQAIIAFGGGSVMDCAKALGAQIVKPKMSLKKMQGLIKIRKKLPLLIAIPTTAGSGSEATVASVIVDSASHHKYVINDFCLIPEYAVMLPSVTMALPKNITAITGMDALTHAVEVYVGRSMTKKSKKASEEAIKLIFDNLELAYNDGKNLEARRNMLHASYLAGTAFTKSYVGYVHALAHPLGGRYGVAHGLANAVLLPYVLRAYGDSITLKLAQLAKLVGLVEGNISNEEAAEVFISRIEEMNYKMDIPSKLDCVRKNDISEMAQLADREANPLYPVPVLWDAKELEKLYFLICDDVN
jgi:alcohol dehydrogenase class IV